MVEGIELVVAGILMVLAAPFGYYHASWKSPWRFAGCGILFLLLGFAFIAFDAFVPRGLAALISAVGLAILGLLWWQGKI